jgi:hypothetical protein
MDKNQLIQSVLQDNGLQEIMQMLQGMQSMQQQRQQGALGAAEYQNNQAKQQFDMQNMRENTELARGQTEHQMRLAEEEQARLGAADDRAAEKHKLDQSLAPLEKITAVLNWIKQTQGIQQDNVLGQRQIDLSQQQLQNSLPPPMPAAPLPPEWTKQIQPLKLQ